MSIPPTSAISAPQLQTMTSARIMVQVSTPDTSMVHLM